MVNKIQSIKGFYDVSPDVQKIWRYFESKCLSIFDQYGYEEIGLPIIEATELFEAGVGTHTDIVEKEMYSWIDKLNDDKLTLRPEGTAGCVRAVIQGSLTYNGPGESKMANIGISLPGTGEVPVAPVYENGKKTVTLKGSSISEDFKGIIEKYIQNNYEKK